MPPPQSAHGRPATHPSFPPFPPLAAVPADFLSRLWVFLGHLTVCASRGCAASLVILSRFGRLRVRVWASAGQAAPGPSLAAGGAGHPHPWLGGGSRQPPPLVARLSPLCASVPPLSAMPAAGSGPPDGLILNWLQLQRFTGAGGRASAWVRGRGSPGTRCTQPSSRLVCVGGCEGISRVPF